MTLRITLIALSTFVAAGAWCQDAGTDAKGLQGSWIPISAELAGAKFPASELGKIKLQIDRGMYTVQVDKLVDKGTVKIDASKSPRAMDIVGTDGPNKGRTMLAIYELNKDTLRVCYDIQGKERPKEFISSKEKPFFLVVYGRAK